jgi:hypothetical protein
MPENQNCQQTERILTPNEQTRLVAAQEAERMILQHLKLCPFANLNIEARLRKIELRFATLIGFMLGSGMLGGISGALLSKLIGQ